MDDFNEKAGEIRKLASMPETELIDYLSQTHKTFDSVAPHIAPHLFTTATNSIAFLNRKLPPSSGELLQDKIRIPSEGEKKAWLDLYKTVNNPLHVLSHVKHGTLTSHHIEALRSVYPDVHNEMIERVNENLGRLKMEGKKIPYARRVSLSRLLGRPIDSSLTQESMQAIIKSASINTGPEATAPERTGARPSGPAISQINKVNALYRTEPQTRETAKTRLGKGS